MLGRDCCIACLGLTVCTPTLITAGVCSTGFITFLDPHIMALAKPIKSLAFTRAAPFIIEDTWVIPLLWVVALEKFIPSTSNPSMKMDREEFRIFS